MQCSFLTQERHDLFVLSSQINQNGEFEGVGMEVVKQVLSGRL